MTSINTNTDFSNYDKFMDEARSVGGLDKIHDYILTQNDELNQFTADITDAVWDESFPDVRTDLLIQDIHKLRVENESLKKTCLKWQENADFNLTDSDEEEENDKLKKEIRLLKKENDKLKSEGCLQGTYRSLCQLYENQNIEFEGQKNKIKYLEKKNEEFEKRADAWNIKINKLMLLINASNASS